MSILPFEAFWCIAQVLEVGQEDLYEIYQNKADYYRRFPIRSGRSRPRWIDAPKMPLKRVQRRLLDDFLYRFKPSSAAHGFYPGRSIITNASMHVKRNWVFSFDIKDFFPSTSEVSIIKMMRRLDSLQPKEVWDFVGGMCTLRGVLPQGAPTSPHLANLVCIELDHKLSKLARKHEMAYTRYADDMTFSGDVYPNGLIGEVRICLLGEGYQLSERKTKIMGRNHRQMVTGLVVNEKVALPRTLKRQLRAILHDAQKNGIEQACRNSGLVDTEQQLQGYLALFQSFKKEVR